MQSQSFNTDGALVIDQSQNVNVDELLKQQFKDADIPPELLKDISKPSTKALTTGQKVGIAIGVILAIGAIGRRCRICWLDGDGNHARSQQE